jgi:hypothetical protein
VVSHCDYNLHSLMTHDTEYFICLLVIHICYFDEMSIKSFAPFIIRLFVFL